MPPIRTDEQIVDDILRREGDTYSNRAADRGGPTKYGITQRTLADWRKHPVTPDDVRNLQESEARAIYMANYVRPFDGVDPAVKAQAVDIAVNSGVLRARGMLSLAEADSRRPLNVALAVQRLKHYGRIVHSDASQAENINGWINRAVEFL